MKVKTCYKDENEQPIMAEDTETYKCLQCNYEFKNYKGPNICIKCYNPYIKNVTNEKDKV